MPQHKQELIHKIEDRQATVGVIGLGYVGLPLVILFAEKKFPVLGFDIDQSKIEQLNSGQSYIKHIPSEKISRILEAQRFSATADLSRLGEADCIIICVPTPLTGMREPDMQYVDFTADQVARHLRPGQLISLESTTYPGTTRERLLPRFENPSLKVGEDFFLTFSPEREDPGNPKYSTANIPKVVGGITPACTATATALYSQVVVEVVPVSSPEAAEFTKLLENIYRSVNIALVNELKVLAQKMDVDIWEIIQASSTKPFGYMPFYPGPGLGGHCIPIDPFYLAWKAREYNFSTHFIELAGEVNTGMPAYVISRLGDVLNTHGKCLKGAKILILGMAYKKDTDDIRETPSLELMELLQAKGAELFYNDPYIPEIPEMRKYELQAKSSELTESLLSSMDAVLISTDHSLYDYEWITAHAPLVLDTRNATKDVIHNREKIVKA